MSTSNGSPDVPRPAIDPTQIVSMALNLSESRRRHLSAGQLLAPPAAVNRRSTSAGLPGMVPMHGSSQGYGAGGSLRQHMQQQRRISRNMSPGSGARTSNSSRHVSSAGSTLVDANAGLEYQFSDATLARAEKARTYLELSVEYRRLLQHLPPLKPNSSASGNTSFSTSSAPGTTGVSLSRTPSHAGNQHNLGRSYNPLQFIRNRKVRRRERKPLNPDIDEFADTVAVKDWVGAVEVESRHPSYRQDDRALLPPFDEQLPEQRHAADSTNKAKPPRLDWIMHPSELLADAYWVEQDGNKGLIENRNGARIFPTLHSPTQYRPRSSTEQARDTKHNRTNTFDSVSTVPQSIRDTDDEAEGTDRGRKRRHLLPHKRTDSESKHKHRRPWHISRARSRSSSGLSSSENESKTESTAKVKKTGLRPDGGPLARHLSDLLEKESQEESITSPSVGSPDTPDKWGNGHKLLKRGLIGSEDTNVEDQPNGHPLRAGTVRRMPAESLQRGRGKDSEEPRSSFEDLETEPNSPVTGNFMPGIGIDLTPPTSRKSSPTRKDGKSRLAALRSDMSFKSHKSDKDKQDSAYAASDSQSRNTSGEQQQQSSTRSSLDRNRTPTKQQLASRKTDESFGSTKADRKAGHPNSSVARFFKGGRLGGMVRDGGSKMSEFIFKKDSPDESTAEATATDTDDLSDADVIDELRKKRPSAPTRSTTASSVAGTEPSRGRPKYHLNNLPSFKPAHMQRDDSRDHSPGSTTSDPITAQQQALRQRGRSPRLDRLMPPRLEITNTDPDSGRSRSSSVTQGKHHSSGDTSRSRSPSRTRTRINTFLARPGGAGRAGLPYTPLATATSRGRSYSRPAHEGKRHWSISDPKANPLSRTQSKQEIEVSLVESSKTELNRIKALLMCTGIKARGLALRAESIPPEPTLFLANAAKAAGIQNFRRVKIREEHVLAAKILCKGLENETSALQSAVHSFQAQKIKTLHERLEALRLTVAGNNDDKPGLSKTVHDIADDADDFTAQLTNKYPLEIKGLVDRIDGMMRVRRRRLRWLRRAGWASLEWIVLGVMWWVWLVVVVIRTVGRVFWAIGRGVRWVLWI